MFEGGVNFIKGGLCGPRRVKSAYLREGWGAIKPSRMRAYTAR